MLAVFLGVPLDALLTIESAPSDVRSPVTAQGNLPLRRSMNYGPGQCCQA